MKSKLIACEMIRDEVEKAMEETGYDGSVAWLEDSLHTHPEKLRNALQQEIEEAEGEGVCRFSCLRYCGNTFRPSFSGIPE